MKRLMRGTLGTLFVFFTGINYAFAIKSHQLSRVFAVSVLSIEGTRLKNPQINVTGKTLAGADVTLAFTYNSETAKNCLNFANEAVSSKKKMIINLSDTPLNGEYKVFGCATGYGALPIPVF